MYSSTTAHPNSERSASVSSFWQHAYLPSASLALESMLTLLVPSSPASNLPRWPAPASACPPRRIEGVLVLVPLLFKCIGIAIAYIAVLHTNLCNVRHLLCVSVTKRAVSFLVFCYMCSFYRSALPALAASFSDLV